jgi:hypothetical protein
LWTDTAGKLSGTATKPNLSAMNNTWPITARLGGSVLSSPVSFSGIYRLAQWYDDSSCASATTLAEDESCLAHVVASTDYTTKVHTTDTVYWPKWIAASVVTTKTGYTGVASTPVTVADVTTGTMVNETATAGLVEGTTVWWVYTVENTGGFNLSDVTVSDDRIDDTCIVTTLDPGESGQCFLSGVLTNTGGGA